MMEPRTRFEAAHDKRQAVKDAESAGHVADSRLYETARRSLVMP
jgi:hypothetical protein